MNDNRQKLLERLRGIAAMADPERNPNMNEVKVAARKLEQAMAENAVSWVELLQDKDATAEQVKEEFVDKVGEVLLGAFKPWHWALARGIGMITATKHFGRQGFGERMRDKDYGKGWRMAFFGTRSSVEAAAFLYDRWIRALDKMATQATSDYCDDLKEDFGVKNPIRDIRFENPEDHPTAWRNNWLRGCTNGIIEVIYEQQEKRKEIAQQLQQGKTPTRKMIQADDETGQPISDTALVAQSNALMILNKKLDEAYTDFSKDFQKSSGRSTGSYNNTAYNSGKKVGRSLNLTSKELKG